MSTPKIISAFKVSYMQNARKPSYKLSWWFGCGGSSTGHLWDWIDHMSSNRKWSLESKCTCYVNPNFVFDPLAFFVLVFWLSWTGVYICTYSCKDTILSCHPLSLARRLVQSFINNFEDVLEDYIHCEVCRMWCHRDSEQCCLSPLLLQRKHRLEYSRASSKVRFRNFETPITF